MSNSTSDPMYALRDIPGRGKGLVATRNILMGTRILSEEPIIRLPETGLSTQALTESIHRQVDALSPGQRHAFLSLPNIHEDHFFSPYGTWNNNIHRFTVHARRDIEKGTELTIFHLEILNNRNARREALLRRFAFICSCGLCSLPPDQSQQSDERLEEILHLDTLISESDLNEILSSPLKVHRNVDRQVQLYTEHGPNENGLPKAFFHAVQIAIANGDLARGRVFAERAVRGWTILAGEDNSDVLRYSNLSQNPSQFPLYGRLGPIELEDWLWRRNKPQRPGQSENFRNRTIFPGFTELPDKEEDVQPQRHWLFLGEILDFSVSLRLEVRLRDVDGTAIPLFFYTEGLGSELAPTKLQKGYTVVVLYAQRHAFAEPGIRHEELRNLKIFPLSLDKLLALSDRIQKFSLEVNGARICHGCEKQSDSLKKCARCSLFWYCGGTCQKAGWGGKGHKEDCKVLKDADLRGLFSINWNHFENSAEFRLRISMV